MTVRPGTTTQAPGGVLGGEAADLAGWIANGPTGISSEALAAAAFGNYPTSWGHTCYPHDGGDLARCLILIERCPWAARGLAVLASKNAVWARLVEAWDELLELREHDERERAGRWRMPKGWRSRVYGRMQHLIYQRPDISGGWESFTDAQGRWDHRKIERLSTPDTAEPQVSPGIAPQPQPSGEAE